jgi:hypothetical protein
MLVKSTSQGMMTVPQAGDGNGTRRRSGARRGHQRRSPGPRAGSKQSAARPSVDQRERVAAADVQHGICDVAGAQGPASLNAVCVMQE